MRQRCSVGRQRAGMGRHGSAGVGKVAFPTNKNALGRETGPAAATTTKARTDPTLLDPRRSEPSGPFDGLAGVVELARHPGQVRFEAQDLETEVAPA